MRKSWKLARNRVIPSLRNKRGAFQWIPVDRLDIPDEYQRPQSKEWVQDIANHWSWPLCGVLVVIRKGRGRYDVAVGGHRMRAAKMRGDISKLPCMVFDHVNTKQAAGVFFATDTGRKPISSRDSFRALVANGDEEACTAAAVLDKNHVPWQNGHGKFTAFATVLSLDPSALDETLKFVNAAWPDQHERFNGYVISGAEIFRGHIQRHLKMSLLTPRVRNCFARKSLNGLYGQSQQIKAGVGGTREKCFAMAMAQAWNYNRQAKHRVPSEV